MPCRVLFLVATLLLAVTLPARAQFGGGPPAVGVTEAKLLPVTETSEFVGRVQAIEKVDLIARVTAFLDQRLFIEGTEVKKGDLLYRLERGPFEADVAAKQAAVGADRRRSLRNATMHAEPGAVAAEHAGRPARRRSMTRWPSSAARRRRCWPPRRSCARRRSTSTTPRSARRSPARSAAPT